MSRPNLDLRWLAAACAMLLVCWGVILLGIDDASMWFDDDYSWRITSEGVLDAVRATAADVHPPIYYLLLWGWRAVTGSDALLVMRLTAAYPALLAVAVMYRLGWLWFRRGDVALAAALFLGTSGMFVFYGRVLRMYALVLLLLMVSWWMLTRLLSRRRGGIVLYGLSLAAMAWTFYFAAFGVLTQALYVLVARRDRLRATLAAYALAAVLFAPWLPTFINQMGVARSQSNDPDAPLIGKFLGTIPTNLDTLATAAQLHTSGQPAYVAALLLLGLAFGWRRRGTFIALSWFFGTIGLLLALNLVIPVYSHRYTLIAVPGLALLAGLAVGSVPGWAARWGLVLLVTGVGLAAHPIGFPEDPIPHEALLTTVNERFREDDIVWYNLDAGARGSSIYGKPGEYHLYKDAPRLSPSGEDFVWAAPTEFREADERPRVWDARPYWIEPLSDARAALESGRMVTEQYNFGDYRLRLYEAYPEPDARVTVGDLPLALYTMPPPKPTYAPGETVPLKVWWQKTGDLQLDYSWALQLRTTDGAVVSQRDETLLRGTATTSQWFTVPEPQYTSAAYTLPDDLPPGEYAVWAVVYFWQTPDEPFPLMTAGEAAPPTDGPAVRLAAFAVE